MTNHGSCTRSNRVLGINGTKNRVKVTRVVQISTTVSPSDKFPINPLRAIAVGGVRVA